jgi:protein ImuA
MNIESAHTVASLRRAILPLEEQHPYGRATLGHAGADPCLCGGLLRGAQHEVFAQTGHAPAAIGFAALLAARVAEKKPLLWIRQDFSQAEHGEISGSGICELGLDPKTLLLMRAADAKDALRASADALSCASLGAVILELPGNPKLFDLTQSRRLTLACAHKGVTAILLRLDAKIATSAAETRWHIQGTPSLAADENWGAPRFLAELVRNRHGALGRWIMQWDANHGCFTDAAADSRAVAETAFDRQNPPAALLRSVFAKATTDSRTQFTRRSFSAGGRAG